MPLRGRVVTSKDKASEGCVLLLRACDKMGNACTKGGATVRCGCRDVNVDSSCEDLGDGTYSEPSSALQCASFRHRCNALLPLSDTPLLLLCPCRYVQAPLALREERPIHRQRNGRRPPRHQLARTNAPRLRQPRFQPDGPIRRRPLQRDRRKAGDYTGAVCRCVRQPDAARGDDEHDEIWDRPYKGVVGTGKQSRAARMQAETPTAFLPTLTSSFSNPRTSLAHTRITHPHRRKRTSRRHSPPGAC